MSKTYASLALPTFIFWPFGAFILSLFNLKSKASAIVYILFSTLLGYAFSFMDTSADSYRVAMVFDLFNFSSLNDIYNLYLAGGVVDLYRFLLYGITKTFTNNPKVLFAFFGLFFGIFSYLSLLLLVKEKGNRQGFFWMVLLFIFFASNPLTNINGARFWTATWVFFYSVTNFLFYNKKLWGFGILGAFLIHFSFLFAIVPILLFYFFQGFFYSQSKTHSWLFLVFVITFFGSFVLETNAFNIGFLSELSFVSSSISSKIDLYNSDRITEAVNNRSTTLFHTVTRYFGYLKKVYFFIFILIARKNISRLDIPKENLNKLLSFILFFLSFGFIASSIPSGARFVAIGYLFVILLFVKLFYLFPTPRLKNLILLSLPAFSFSILFGIGYMSYAVVDPSLWYGNLIYIIWDGLGFEFVYRL